MHRWELKSAAGKVWLQRVIALVFGMALLGSCGPTAEALTRGDLRVDVTALKAKATPGRPVTVGLSITNSGRFNTRLQLAGTADWIEPSMSGQLSVPGGEEVRVEVELRCLSGGVVQHAWLLLEGDDGSLVVPARLDCATSSRAGTATAAAEHVGAPDSDEFSPDSPLSLEPPLLHDARLVRIDPESGPFVLELDLDADYLILMPDEPLRRGVTVGGGRNVVMIGGEIDIPWQGRDPGIEQRRGLYIRRTTGTFHLEGLLLHGEDISEGIQLNAPDASIQITNVAVLDIKARDQIHFRDNHPDLIQSFGGGNSIAVDRFSGSTDYQGFLFQVTSDVHGHGPVSLSRVNITGRPTARYLLWFALPHDGETVIMEDVWLDVPRQRRGGLGRAVWPDVNGDHPRRAERFRVAGRDAVHWPFEMVPPIIGHVLEGSPPHGDFVDPDLIGIGYRSPGYVGGP